MSRESIAVIDIETSWYDDVMSIGLALGDLETYSLLDCRYFVIEPYVRHGGMFSGSIFLNNINVDLICSKDKAIEEIIEFLRKQTVSKIFAYNASFDYSHLLELRRYNWYDIMAVAAYTQYNSKIPSHWDCYKTGRLKRGYGVENIYRILSDDFSYSETHNALLDAVDELKIMRMLGHDISIYRKLN